MIVTTEFAASKVWELWQFLKAFLLHKASYVIQIDFLITVDPNADTGSIVYSSSIGSA